MVATFIPKKISWKCTLKVIFVGNLFFTNLLVSFFYIGYIISCLLVVPTFSGSVPTSKEKRQLTLRGLEWTEKQKKMPGFDTHIFWLGIPQGSQTYPYENTRSMTWREKSLNLSQHDEVEPNLKKILHTNGIWGLEANSM